MEGDTLFNEAQKLEKRFLQYKQFWDNLMQQSNSLDKEKLLLCNRLSKLNFEINNLQKNKTQLDKLKCKLEMDVEELSEKSKQYEFLKTHLEVLNQRKDQLEKYSLTKGLEFEENMLQDKIDNVWKYFNDKDSKLDEEIKELELKLANRQEMVSKMFEKECNQYKKSIEKLNNENSVLNKKLCLISKIREDSNE
ncbi:uncharacterized protein LOC100570963 [Acyrthosiphon pisum]|uniref:Uncharacterized protein n=1 Tax=Acyrthosiphon pisum TaxID=7029 RepID=A0A8R2NSV2_ACYPI|nr:uncharacterized protein LOC100570963 [Acyrthosiphon pisum]|eukprot:XP_016662346.1 PREDICTED: uncharacterized protein LOC100570963 [Acyrthosiphon pisum]